MAGRVIEKISVKVIPDLSGFRDELKRRLQSMPGVAVEIDTKLGDTAKFRADLERLTRDRAIKITPEVDDRVFDRYQREWDQAGRQVAQSNKRSMESIRRAFGDLVRRGDFVIPVEIERNNEKFTRVMREIENLFQQYEREHALRLDVELDETHKERLQQELDNLIRKYDGQNVELEANAQTFIAARQLAWVSRTRIVDLYVRVNEKSITAAATTIAALSGGRLIGEVGTDVFDFFKDLDKNIPSLTMWTTGIINLTGSLVGMMTQLITFSADVARIGPLFLTLPGLAMGAVTAFMVTLNAWANVKDELEALADPITNLRDLMNDAYWEEARAPITDLVMNLMPQLEVVMTDASRAMGNFAGAFAEAMEHQLAGGRLEEIFGTMEQGFRILTEGADGYAGTVVNLALIAGRYWPRLAEWMNRQATAFSNWMDAIITDGRLDAWMERAIDNLYELGFGLADMGRLLRGLTTAAEAAGSVGLAGFHDTMERWQEVINSPNGQRALTDYFIGGRKAAEGLGEAIENIFVALSRVSDGVRDTFAQSGATIAEIGGLFGDVLGSASLWRGLETMLERMQSGVAKLRDSSDEVSEFLGSAAELVGHFADVLAGPLAAALEVVLPHLTSLQGPFERLLTALADGLESLIRSSDFDKLMGTLAELIEILIQLALDAIPVVLPVLEQLLGLLASQPAEVWLLWLGSAVVIGGLVRFAKFAWPVVDALRSMGGAGAGAAGGVGKFVGAMRGVGWAALVAGAVIALDALGTAMENSVADVAEWENALATGGDKAALFMEGFKLGPMLTQDLLGVSDLEQFKNALDKIDVVKLGDALDPFGTSDYRQVMLAMDNFGEAMAGIASQDFSQAVDQFNDLRAEMDLSNEQAGELIWNADAYRDALYQQATALGINMTGLSDAEQRQVLLAIATKDASVATGDAADALDNTGSYFSDYSRLVGEAADEVNRLIEAQQLLNDEFWTQEGGFRALGQNLRDFEAQMQSVLESQEAITVDGWFNYDTQAGADASLAFESFIQGQNDALVGLQELGVEHDTLMQHFADSEASLREWGAAIGLSPEQIEVLVAQLIEPTDEAVRKFEENGDEAARRWSRAVEDGLSSENPFSRAVDGGAGGGSLSELSDKFSRAGADAVDSLRVAMAEFDGESVGSMIGQRLTQGFAGTVPEVESTAHGMTRSVDAQMQELAGHGFTRATELGDGLNRGLNQAQVAAVATVHRMVATMLGAMAVMNTAGFGVGASLGQGIARGIQSTIAAVAASAAALVNAATAAAKKAGDINSPSRLWDREIGYQLGAGGARGIARSAVLMANAARDAIPSPLVGDGGGGFGGGAAPTIGAVTLVSKNDDPAEDIRDVVHYVKTHTGGGVV